MASGAYLRVTCPFSARGVRVSIRRGGHIVTVKRVGIVGSGIMGSGIAEVAAKAGFEVSLRSRQQNTADRMMAGLEKSLGKQVDKGKLDAAERDTVLGRVRRRHRPRRARRVRPS